MLLSIAAMGEKHNISIYNLSASHIKITPTSRLAHIWNTALSLPGTWGIQVRPGTLLVTIESLSFFFYPSFRMGRKLASRKVLASVVYILLFSRILVYAFSEKDAFVPLELAPWGGCPGDGYSSVCETFVRLRDLTFYSSGDEILCGWCDSKNIRNLRS